MLFFKTGIYKKFQRGSALTELVILIFPYAMIMIGVSVLGMLALGKQEAQKAVMLAAPLPDIQTWADIENKVFPGIAGDERIEVEFTENTDFVPEQKYSDQEPILPYANSSKAGQKNDIHAGFVRLGYTSSSSSTISAGSITTQTSTELNRLGSLLESYAIMPEREDDIAGALNGWLDYSQAEATFSFTYGGGKLPYEKDPADANRDIRGKFELKSPAGEKGVAYYSVARTALERGVHRRSGNSYMSLADINLAAIAGLPNWGSDSILDLETPDVDYSLYGDTNNTWNQENLRSDWDP